MKENRKGVICVKVLEATLTITSLEVRENEDSHALPKEVGSFWACRALLPRAEPPDEREYRVLSRAITLWLAKALAQKGFPPLDELDGIFLISTIPGEEVPLRALMDFKKR